MASADEQQDIEDARRARAIRLERDRQLSPEERLAQLDDLLRAAALLRTLPRHPAA